jgi:hypothetical protein
LSRSRRLPGRSICLPRVRGSNQRRVCLLRHVTATDHDAYLNTVHAPVMAPHTTTTGTATSATTPAIGRERPPGTGRGCPSPSNPGVAHARSPLPLLASVASRAAQNAALSGSLPLPNLAKIRATIVVGRRHRSRTPTLRRHVPGGNTSPRAFCPPVFPLPSSSSRADQAG